MRRIVQPPRVLPPVVGPRRNVGVRWAPRGPGYGRFYRPGLRGYDDVAGLEGWGKIMEKVRKTVKAPVKLVQKAVKPITKMLPTPIRKAIAIPGKAFDTVREKASKVEDVVRQVVPGAAEKDDKPKTVVEQPAATEIEPEPQLLPAPATAEEPPDRTLLIAGSIVGAVAVGVAVWMIVRARRRG